MHRGYVRLWRKTVDSFVMSNEGLFHLFGYILMNVSHKDTTWQGIELKAGQMVAGRLTLSHALRQKPSTIWKRLRRLEAGSVVGLKSNNKFTIITLCNWDLYNGEVTTKEQKRNNKGTTKEQQSDTYNNDKNKKNEKNIDKNGDINASQCGFKDNSFAQLNNEEVEHSSEGGGRISKTENSRSNGKCLFRDSVYSSISFFRDTLRKAEPEMSEEECKYWFEECLGYSEAKGAKYINWAMAALNWRRKRISEGKPFIGFKKTETQSTQPPYHNKFVFNFPKSNEVSGV